jgi:hypothetical protein
MHSCYPVNVACLLVASTQHDAAVLVTALGVFPPKFFESPARVSVAAGLLETVFMSSRQPPAALCI